MHAGHRSYHTRVFHVCIMTAIITQGPVWYRLPLEKSRDLASFHASTNILHACWRGHETGMLGSASAQEMRSSPQAMFFAQQQLSARHRL